MGEGLAYGLKDKDLISILHHHNRRRDFGNDEMREQLRHQQIKARYYPTDFKINLGA